MLEIYKCEICGEPMPEGEEMFKFHGYSGNCPKTPLPKPAIQNYRKKNVQPMRPYILGEDMTGISVNKEDTPELGGMIAVNPKNGEDRWYVAKQFFLDNYELAE